MAEPVPNRVYTGDCLKLMRSWPDDCVDHCIADPPFGIASGRGRRSKRGLGWAFSSHVTMQETWDQFGEDEYFRFSLDWLREVCRVVKPNGNILVFGTFHSIYLLGFLLGHVLERRILNSIIWFKPNAQPNITARTLTESTEQIIWAANETPKRAKKWTFNYSQAKEINNKKQMRSLWNGAAFNAWAAPVVPASERQHGKHPTQKPRAIVDRLVQLFSKRDQLILDPFAGTGVVALSAVANGRRHVLIEKEQRFVQAARERLREQRTSREVRVLRALGDSIMTLNDVELNILQRIPVPQADDLDKVFEVLELVDQGLNTADEIAEMLDLVPRQGNYYADAAVALRIVAVQKDMTAEGRDRFVVADVGRQYLDATPEDRPAKKRFAVLNSPIMKYVSSQLGITENGAHAPYPPPPEMRDETTIAAALRPLGVTGNTPQRRAKTIAAWLGAV